MEHLTELERQIQNRWADGYDAIFYERPVGIGNLRDFREYLDRKITQRFVDCTVAERKQLRILDTGCGTGQLLSQLKSDGFTNLYGLDVSEKMVQIASQKCPTISFTIGPFDSVPLPIGQFDVIMGTEWLHHVPILRPVFQRAYDLLAPGGFFCAMEPHNDWLFQQVGLRQSVMTLLFGPLLHLVGFKNRNKIQALSELEGDRGYTSWHRHLSVRELREAFDGIGFEVEMERRHTLVTYFAGQLFNSRADRMLYGLLRWLDRNMIDHMGRGGYLFLCATKPRHPRSGIRGA